MTAEHPARSPSTLSDVIRLSLADEISDGRMMPGAEIDELAIARRFGASRTPVREALRELAASGLVVTEPRRRARVAEMTAARLGDLFELMAETEALCVRFATYRMTAAERGALVGLQRAAWAIAAAGDLDAYDRLNRDFHSALYRASHNEALIEQAVALRQRLAPFRRAQFRTADRLRRSEAEHEAIVAQMLQGDAETASRLMRAHILAANIALDERRRSLDADAAREGQRDSVDEAAPNTSATLPTMSR